MDIVTVLSNLLHQIATALDADSGRWPHSGIIRQYLDLEQQVVLQPPHLRIHDYEPTALVLPLLNMENPPLSIRTKVSAMTERPSDRYSL